ncbi:MAG TPA: polyphosphate kinase 1 [Candidatus Binatia bacterium]
MDVSSSPATPRQIPLDSPEAFLNRELSWLAFARRVLELAGDPELPLLERVKFLGIHAMLHDEFFMKRVGGLLQQVRRSGARRSPDGRTPHEELEACRAEVRSQLEVVSALMLRDIRPALREAGLAILDWEELDEAQQSALREDFEHTVLPILTPLAIDAEHPFPFISGQGLNLAIQFPTAGGRERVLRLKVPTNRSRWVAVPGPAGFVALEQVIAANLDLVVSGSDTFRHYFFSVTRAVEADPEIIDDEDEAEALLPGAIVRQVTRDLKARRFAGVSGLKVSSDMPVELQTWLARQLGLSIDDVYVTETFLGLSDLMSLRVPDAETLLLPPYEPVDHPRLRSDDAEPGSMFREIARGDILLHHPYHSYESSVVRFLQEAAEDPQVLALKITIYRTSRDSPIIRALAEAARRGKQVAVLVEITARFDEAPNIAWGQFLEREGVHVSYGVEKLKTHVKLALVVRDEGGKLHQYVHIGTGNYHEGTARIYEDLGLLTADAGLCRDVALLFNQLTGALKPRSYGKLIVAPQHMRTRFIELIRREAEHAREGRPSGIRAKMNQLQDQELIRELYEAGRAGVPVSLDVRGLCCIRPGVAGLSENIQVFSIVGRFLEHSRLYEFRNGGHPEYFIGSADWMKRNLDRRVESIAPVLDPKLCRELSAILDVFDTDNYSRWDCNPDGTYTRRRPTAGEARRDSHEIFLEMAAKQKAAPAKIRSARRRKD